MYGALTAITLQAIEQVPSAVFRIVVGNNSAVNMYKDVKANAPPNLRNKSINNAALPSELGRNPIPRQPTAANMKPITKVVFLPQ